MKNTSTQPLFRKTGKAASAFAAAAFGMGVTALADSAFIASSTDGAAYSIDTGYRIKPTTGIYADFEFLAGTTSYQQFVFEATGGGTARFYINGSGQLAWNFTTQQIWSRTEVAMEPGTRYQMMVDASTRSAWLDVEGTRRYSAGFADNTVVPNYGNTVKLFSNNAGTGNAAMMKLYRFAITESGETVHDYVPARKGGITGMFDQKTGEFIYDARNSPMAFSSGGDILELEDDPYVENTGSGQINTRFFMAPDTKVDVDYALVETTPTQARVFGANAAGTDFKASYYINDGGNMSFGVGDTPMSWATSCAANLFRHRAVMDLAGDHAYYITRSVTNWTGTASGLGASMTKTSTHPLAIFGGATAASGMSFGNPCKVKIYGVKCWKAGRLVHDYVPCVKGGTPGFKDLVDGSFISGENTAALTAGGKGLAVEEDDGYVSTSGGGSRFFDTGYTASAGTRVELDYALADNYPGSGDWFLFEASGSHRIATYINANQMGWCGCGTNWRNWNIKPPAQTTQKGVRRTAIVDNGGWSGIITAGFTNCYSSVTPTTTATYGSKTLHLASNSSKGGFSSIKIYGVKVFESGTLQRTYKPYVKNGVPGLLDTYGTGGFISAGIATNALKIVAGGNIDSDTVSRDAYIESDGTQYLKFPDFYQDYATRVELDCQMLDPQKTSTQYLFGNFGAVSGYLCFSMYVRSTSESPANAITWNCKKDSSNWTSIGGSSATADRMSFILDALGKKASVVSAAGITNYSATIGYDLAGTASKFPLTVCAAVNAEGNASTPLTRLRIYGVKLYKGGSLVHNYLPSKQNGVVGLKDTETGNFTAAANASAGAFTMSGMGAEGAERWIVSPRNATVSKKAGTTVLSANASGATSYKWTKNGAAIDGGADGDLTVQWTKSGATDTYAVTPVYSVFGKETEGEPVAVSVQSLPEVFVIVVR